MPPQLPQNVPSRAHEIIVTCIVCPLVATIFVAIRVWTSIVVTRNLGCDDYAAIITLFFCIAFSIVLAISTQYGMGLHLYDMTPELVIDHSQWIYISSAFYLPSILGYRIALLLMYLRLFGVNQTFRYATWAVMFFVTSYLTSNIITLIFGCSPIAKYWKSDEPGHCLNLVMADHAYGSMNVVSDVLLFLLPLPMVWQLNLTRKDKWGVALVFMGGIGNCVVTTLRFALLVQNLHAPDPAWDDARTFLLTGIEISTGLICGCMPILKPFFRHVFLSQPPRINNRQSQQRLVMETRVSSVWMGKFPDDRSRCNYREFIEMDDGKETGDGGSDKGGREC